MKEVRYKSREEIKAEANAITNGMIHWLGKEGWKKHLIEVVDYLYPKTPKKCKNLREVKEYKKDRERFIKTAKDFFNAV